MNGGIIEACWMSLKKEKVSRTDRVHCRKEYQEQNRRISETLLNKKIKAYFLCLQLDLLLNV